jgi:hypothetical protein
VRAIFDQMEPHAVRSDRNPLQRFGQSEEMVPTERRGDTPPVSVSACPNSVIAAIATSNASEL